MYRHTAIAWGLFLLPLPACVGPARPGAATPAPIRVGVPNATSPAMAAGRGTPATASRPITPSVATAPATAPASTPTTQAVAATATGEERYQFSIPPRTEVAAATPGEERYQFSIPPRTEVAKQSPPPGEEAPRTLPIAVEDPEEKVVRAPLTDSIPPFEKTPPPGEATEPAPRVIASTEPRTPAPEAPPAASPAAAPAPVVANALTAEAKDREGVVAPDWPAIVPGRGRPVPAMKPAPEVASSDSKPRADAVQAPPYPEVLPVVRRTPAPAPAPTPAPMTMPELSPAPTPPPAVANRPAPAPAMLMVPIPVPTPVPAPAPISPEERREAIRQIVQETLRELPKPVPTPAPAPTPTTPPAVASAPVAETPLVRAIRAFQAKDHSAADAALKEYDPQNRELLAGLLPLLARLGEGGVAAMSPEELSRSLDTLQGASATLRGRAALKAETVCFCKRVIKFGKYDPIEPEHIYQPGEPVEVYFELRNFTWEAARAPEGGCAMRLGSTLEIRDGNQQVVWRRDLTTTDSRQSPPTDYYLVYRFALPELPAGAYTLQMQVVDQLDPLHRLTRRGLELRVGGKQ